MSSAIPVTGGDMSEANNDAELSGRSSLLYKAYKATLCVRAKNYIRLSCIKSRLLEVKYNDVF